MFDIGNKVRVIDGFGDLLQDLVYTISAISDNKEPTVKVAEVGGWWNASRFVLVTAAAEVPGRKDDGGKLDLTLLFDDCPHALEAVAEVLQWAVTKKQPVPYERGSWQGVDDFQRRYRAAMQRHMLGSAKERLANGLPIEQTTDHETGLLELAHIATDAIFQLEMAIRRTKGIA